MVVQSAFLLLFYLSISYSAEILLECDKDIDCGAGYFCFLSFCERCIPCDIHFHRQPARSSSGESICAKYEDDCGVCQPGYQANDLTDQRRSMECFPLNDGTVSTSTNFSWTGIVWIACVLLLTMTFIACFLKCRRMQPGVSNKEEEEEEVENDRRPSAPPAYTAEDPMGRYQAVPLIVLQQEADHVIVGSVRTSDRMIIVEEIEHHNRAVPIYPDQHFDGNRQSHHESDSEVEEQLLLDPPVDNEDSNGNGSTETIPSQWEPTPSISNMSVNAVLFVRSQSEEMIRRTSSTSQLVRLASDPEILSLRRASVGGETYSYRHVRLSQYRSNSQTIDGADPETAESSEVESKSGGDLNRDSRLTEPCEDGREPDAPESFLIAEDGSDLSPAIRDTWIFQNDRATATRFLVAFSSQPPGGGGSQDSGFQEQSRRRSRTNEDLLEVNSVLSAKRLRRNCADDE